MKIKTILVMFMALLLTACSNASSGTATIGKITISDAWVHATTTMDHGTHDTSMKMDGPNSAAYMTIENKLALKFKNKVRSQSAVSLDVPVRENK